MKDQAGIKENIDFNIPEERDIYRHSTSHVLAHAVKELFPGAKLAIGPAIEDGFYYDFDVDCSFTPEDLEKIEEKMAEIIKNKIPFKREEISKDDAVQLFTEKGEIYKLELLKDLESDTVSIYRNDDFVDMCRGPHLADTGCIKSFKLLSIAGAYFRGDEKNKMLQRIYGTAFPDKKSLKIYLNRLEEAKKRDHRLIGKNLDLFSTQEEAGAGLIFWHPKGARIRQLVEDFWKQEHFKRGYDFLYIPHILKMDLWQKSGHLDFYKENMYSPMEIDNQKYIVKPMNCPGHILIYKSSLKSYRDLPLRWGELGTVYRYERSGVLHGMMRVRGFTQDDAHIFCTPQQLEGEIIQVLDLSDFMMKTFGFKYKVYLSTRPEKYVGSLENWDKATAALKAALEKCQIPYEVDPGEGVFYGPKIDIKMIDALGRGWQGPTTQVDFNLPERFDVTYKDSEGKDAQVVMIHRTVLGSMERFIGVLIEHYGGDFPCWLSPIQARLVVVKKDLNDYAEVICKKLKDIGIRAEFDSRDEKLGWKIRNAEKEKIPYVLVIGEKEASQGTVNVRVRKTQKQEEMTVEEFISQVEAENRAKQ